MSNPETVGNKIRATLAATLTIAAGGLAITEATGLSSVIPGVGQEASALGAQPQRVTNGSPVCLHYAANIHFRKGSIKGFEDFRPDHPDNAGITATQGATKRYVPLRASSINAIVIGTVGSFLTLDTGKSQFVDGNQGELHKGVELDRCKTGREGVPKTTPSKEPSTGPTGVETGDESTGADLSTPIGRPSLAGMSGEEVLITEKGKIKSVYDPNCDDLAQKGVDLGGTIKTYVLKGSTLYAKAIAKDVGVDRSVSTFKSLLGPSAAFSSAYYQMLTNAPRTGWYEFPLRTTNIEDLSTVDGDQSKIRVITKQIFPTGTEKVTPSPWLTVLDACTPSDPATVDGTTPSNKTQLPTGSDKAEESDFAGA